jgi:hypothetical protein
MFPKKVNIRMMRSIELGSLVLGEMITQQGGKCAIVRGVLMAGNGRDRGSSADPWSRFLFLSLLLSGLKTTDAVPFTLWLVFSGQVARCWRRRGDMDDYLVHQILEFNRCNVEMVMPVAAIGYWMQ